MPLTLRIDPWNPAYESALQIDQDDSGPPEAVDPFVETEDWGPKAPEAYPLPGAITFVDGVQRLEAGVIGEEAGQFIHGAFASIAVGAVQAQAGTSSAPSHTERVLALTDGRTTDPYDISCGTTTLRFEVETTAATGLNGVQEAVQNARRAAETNLGERLVKEGHPLVIVDGRLNLQPTRKSATVGLVKTIHRRYLPDDQQAVLPRLRPGVRTPLFRIPRDRPVYSWYLRLAEPRIIDYSWAGIVRVETLDSIGIEAAVRVADITTTYLPSYASDPAWDPRAPQNLYPISALEQSLRHQMGDHEWIRRHIEAHLHETTAAPS